MRTCSRRDSSEKNVLLFEASVTPANRRAYDGVYRYAEAARWNVRSLEYSLLPFTEDTIWSRQRGDAFVNLVKANGFDARQLSFPKGMTGIVQLTKCLVPQLSAATSRSAPDRLFAPGAWNMQTMGSVNTVCSNGKIILAISVNFFRAVLWYTTAS